MPRKLWTRNEVEGLVSQWFLDNPAEARREMAISIRTVGMAISIRDAVKKAKHVYRHSGVSFGRVYGLDGDGPQVDVFVKWREEDSTPHVRLLGGVTEDGCAYLLADGPHDQRASARAEYEKAFPATMSA